MLGHLRDVWTLHGIMSIATACIYRPPPLRCPCRWEHRFEAAQAEISSFTI